MENLWRVSYSGVASYGPGYGYDNRQRFAKQRAIVQYSIEGRLDWHDAQGHQHVGPGHFVIFTLDEASSFGLDAGNPGPYRCRWLSLAGAGIDPLWRAVIARYGCIHGPDDGLVLSAMQQLGIDSDTASVHQFVGTVMQWIGSREATLVSPVERALRDLEDHPFSDIGIAELAARHGVSREHMSMVFRQRHGMPPARWLRERRLSYARELLASSPLRLGEVAERCGMGSARRLSRALKRDNQRFSQSG